MPQTEMDENFGRVADLTMEEEQLIEELRKRKSQLLREIQNMTDLLAQQQKTKYYQQAKDKRYNRLCKTDAAVDNEIQKQVDRMQAMVAIVDRLTQEYPHAQPALRKVSLAYGSRAQP